jgi:hypothetical protein
MDTLVAIERALAGDDPDELRKALGEGGAEVPTLLPQHPSRCAAGAWNSHAYASMNASKLQPLLTSACAPASCVMGLWRHFLLASRSGS